MRHFLSVLCIFALAPFVRAWFIFNTIPGSIGIIFVSAVLLRGTRHAIA